MKYDENIDLYKGMGTIYWSYSIIMPFCFMAFIVG
jgi:hypothetical protein